MGTKHWSEFLRRTDMASARQSAYSFGPAERALGAGDHAIGREHASNEHFR